MSAREAATTEELLGELIAVLAAACQEADSRTLCRTGHSAAAVRRAAGAERMRPLAVRLGRLAVAGDYAGIDRLLSGPRTVQDWRRLATLLAMAADPERLELPIVRSAA